MEPRPFHKKLLLILTLAFIACTIIGTLSHESGHYLSAKYLGYKAQIHYASTRISGSSVDTSRNAAQDQLIFSAGGPLQTMFTGTLGFVLLLTFSKRYFHSTILSFWQWIPVFIALFWLRQCLNFALLITHWLFTGVITQHSDEVKLAHQLHLPQLSIGAITACAGLLILLLIIFRFIPRSQKLTFLLAGLIGGPTGYIVWFYLLGPVLLP